MPPSSGEFEPLLGLRGLRIVWEMNRSRFLARPWLGEGEGEVGVLLSCSEGWVGPENSGDRTSFPDAPRNLSSESAPLGPESRDTGEGWGFSVTEAG